MSDPRLESPAFRTAVLHSERIRIIGLIVIVAFLVVFSVVRDLLPIEEHAVRLIALQQAMIAAGVLAIYEVGMLMLVNRALRAGREPPGWIWHVNVIVETMVPTAILFIATHSDYPGPYRALLSPATLLYFVFAILATLRLSPGLCLLTGVSCGAGYLGVVIFTFRHFAAPAWEAGGFGLAVYLTCAMMITLAGVIAAGVTRQIRIHVLVALSEAEARQQVESDLEVARSIQQGLLPRKTPELSGLDIAGWSQPADLTGGDYYDWQELAGDRLVVSLADVTGHGIGPALVTAACRSYARASFLGQEELGRLVDRLHMLLAADLPSSRFVTFAAALFAAGSDRFQMVSAGHGPIFLYSAADQRVHASNADGLPLGVMPEIPYAPARTVEFHAGDILVLITDGFFEWANAAGEQFGTDRLSESIAAACHLSARDMIRCLHADVLRFTSGTRQMDDLTAVIVKRLPAEGSESSEAIESNSS